MYMFIVCLVIYYTSRTLYMYIVNTFRSNQWFY